jgi:hypothetical protein
LVSRNRLRWQSGDNAKQSATLSDDGCAGTVTLLVRNVRELRGSHVASSFWAG